MLSSDGQTRQNRRGKVLAAHDLTGVSEHSQCCSQRCITERRYIFHRASRTKNTQQGQMRRYGKGKKTGDLKWRQPHQPHPGTQCSRCGCFLPDLTRFTGNRCGGTDGVTITTLASRQAGPLYRSHRKLQPLAQD